MGRRDERTDRRHEAPRAKPEETPRPGADDRTAFARSPHLRLPETPVREPIEHGRHQYRLNGEETRILATVGAFRVIPATDLDGASRDTDVWNGPIRALADQGLVERRTLVINEQPTAVVALTREGKSLLDASQDGGRDGARQQYHAGLVKPRELAHDSQLLRLYQHAAARLEGEGHRVERVVLDYELKRDYQAFLNRAERSSDVDTDMRAFAEARQLPIVDGHLELPDRIEYETPEGAIEYRDVELVTEHYSRGQLAGKAQAGFSLYRAAGTAKVRGGSTRTGGTPVDPHHLEWLR